MVQATTDRGAYQELKRAVMAGPQVSNVSVLNQHFGGRPTMTFLQPTSHSAALVAIEIAKRCNEILVEIPA
jgi:hypothetical protein